MSLMASISSNIQLDDITYDEDEYDIFSNFSRDELVITLNELLHKIHKMINK